MREKNIGCLLYVPQLGTKPAARHMPWPGLNWQHFALWDNAQPTGAQQDTSQGSYQMFYETSNLTGSQTLQSIFLFKALDFIFMNTVIHVILICFWLFTIIITMNRYELQLCMRHATKLKYIISFNSYNNTMMAVLS